MLILKNLIRRIWNGPSFPAAVMAFCAAILWLQAVTAGRLAIGTGLGSTLALTSASLVGWQFSRMLRLDHIDAHWRLRAVAVMAAFAAMLAPWWLTTSSAALQFISLEMLTRPGVSTLLQLLLVLPPVGLCTAALSLLLTGTSIQSSARRGEFSPAVLIGFALALLVAPTLLFPWVGNRLLSLTALAISLTALLWQERAFSAATTAGEVNGVPHTNDRGLGLWTWGMALLIGAGLATAAAFASQWIPRTFMTDSALPGGLLLGLGLSRLTRSRSENRESGSMTASVLLPGVWMAVLLVLFPCFVGLSLRITTYFSNVVLISAARHLLLLFASLPAGWLLGRFIISAPVHGTGFSTAPFWTLALGYFGMQWLPISPAVAAVSLIVVSLVLSGWSIWNDLRRRSCSRREWGWTAAMSVVAFGGLGLSGMYRPDLAEKLLYSGGMFASLRAGMPAFKLHVLDGGRLVAAADSLWGRSSAWTYRGSQLLVRHNGISAEYRSTNTYLAPHSAADVVPAALAMNLHPAVEHVLLLGWHTPSLETCLDFPIHTVTVVEGDPSVLQLQTQLRSQARSPQVLEEGRYEVRGVDPLMAVQTRHVRQYDLILDSQSQPATTSGGSHRTAEYYAAARRQLADDGLFCQRLAYYDLGPEALARIVATFSEQFPQVMLTESVPGELLLIGSLSEQSLLIPNVLQRLKSPQSRALLARSGLDWSAMLGRGGLDTAAARKFTSEVSARCQLNASDFAFALAWEMLSWGDKAPASRMRLGQHGRSLVTLIGDSSGSREIEARIEDLRTSQQIQDLNPDQPWAYRTAIKQRLSERPRSTIVQVKGEGLKHGLHPEDQRRKDYLVDLAQVSTQEVPPLPDVHALGIYAEPFDPLLSLFVHYEIARLLGQVPGAPSQERFKELVHTVYHSAPGDQSVRNICTAMELLCRDPEAVGSAEDRWDQLNGLLDMLAVRWQSRLADGRQRKYDQVDADHTLKATELALSTMTSLREDVAVSQTDWTLREEVLSEHLLKPVRQHRARLLKQVVLAPGQGTRP